ncbi:MAG: hypothetical protein HQ547_03625, partial [Candidatus Omnitrophica bacterium]|nr:hypothetical protein [Candidatus Omnitrophota bacterium]
MAVRDVTMRMRFRCRPIIIGPIENIDAWFAGFMDVGTFREEKIGRIASRNSNIVIGFCHCLIRV